MNAKNYLKKIGFKKEAIANLKTLKEIHKRHLYNIPFENLDIHSRKKIQLNEKHLYNKFFKEIRGGYCYELNGMFYLLLKKIGFNVKIISARVNNAKGGWGPEFDHLAMIVNLENEKWLADVGFGDSFIEPLVFKIDKLQKNINGWFKIVRCDNKYFKLMKSVDKKIFTDEYLFSLKKRNWKDFEEMNVYQQTSPESYFINRKVCTIPTKNGRVTLTSDKLIITTNGKRKTQKIKDEKDFDKKLFQHFRITVST